MQLNASPLLATAAAPALHKENWQQRRYNFLSKYSMFGGELKEEVADQIGANEQGTDVEQRYGIDSRLRSSKHPNESVLCRPIISRPQIVTAGSMDSEALNVKRESILGMAVTGVRNLLSVSNDEIIDRFLIIIECYFQVDEMSHAKLMRASTSYDEVVTFTKRVSSIEAYDISSHRRKST